MFRTISIICFLITIVGIAFHYLVYRLKSHNLAEKKREPFFIRILQKPIFFLALFLPEQRFSLLEILRKLVYLLAILCFVVLAVTGFYNRLIFDEPLSGYLLMLHATAAPVFAVCLAVLALMWADHCRFSGNDWPWLSHLICRLCQKSPEQNKPSEKSGIMQKICFWLIILLSLPLILSIVLSMFPLFGTSIQKLLFDFHRYSALLLAMVAIIHTYLMMLAQSKGLVE